LPEPGTEDREALVAKARTKNPQAFAPWSKKEEEEIARRYRSGESIEAIARVQKRSARAIELDSSGLGFWRLARSLEQKTGRQERCPFPRHRLKMQG
ncbi:MAG: hypothetical protein ACM3MH_01125, partial [Actinomycetota bacterium]